MRREHFYRNKKALKRSAAGAALALFRIRLTGKRSRPRGLTSRRMQGTMNPGRKRHGK